MASNLEVLLDSVLSSGLIDQLSEIIVVDDGSVDFLATEAVAKSFQEKLQKSELFQVFKLVRLPVNLGRYQARLQGAEVATSESILFLDCRVQLEPEFLVGLKRHFPKEAALMGGIRIDEKASVFNLYWKRTHEKLFRKSIPALGESHYVTADNFSSHVVGTGVLLLSRHDFIDVCRLFDGMRVESDDTLLLAELVKRQRIFRSYDFGVSWAPRQELLPFLKHLLVHRGLTFAEYHVLKRGSSYSMIFYSGLFAVALWGLVFLMWPKYGLGSLAVLLVLVSSSTAYFAKSFREVLLLAPLHLLVIGCYGFGILVGIFRLWGRSLKARVGISRG